MSKPKSKMLTLPGFVAKNGVGSFLEPKDLCAVAQTCRQNRDTYKNNCKASELLFYGLNINKARKKKLLELLAVQKLSPQKLSQSNLSQPNLLQKVLSRLNLSGQKVSPSKASASQQNATGQNLSQNSQNPDAPSVILTRVNGRQVYFSKQLKGMACTRILANLSPLETAALCGDFPLVRLLLENLPDNQNQGAVLQLKRIREKLESDPRSFPSLIITLQKAYKEFIDNYKTLEAAKNWDELDRLSGLIGENQKTLPWFLLQVFCRKVPHEPLPDFTQEPERECLLYNNSELDLDSIGSVSKYALCKGAGGRSGWCAWGADGWPQRGGRLDSEAIDSLCAVIKSELDQIIKLQEQKLLLAEYPDPGQHASTSAPSR